MKKSKNINSQNRVQELSERALSVSDTVPKKVLERIIGMERTYSQRVRKHPFRYPDKNKLRELTLTDIYALEFDSHRLPFLPPASWRQAELKIKARAAKAAGISERTLPDPQVVKSELLRAFGSGAQPFLPIDANGIADGNRSLLRLGSLNLRFHNFEKWRYFEEVDNEVLRRFHLLAVQETDLAGLKAMSAASGCGYACGQANSRGQAVGFAVHPRLRITRIYEYKELTKVQNVPDLRSALRVDLEDSMVLVNGKPFAFTAVVVHLKSMRGGAYATAPIRRQQLRTLVNAMGVVNQFVIILGDFNCTLNSTADTNPLIENGYKLLNPGNRRATHELGVRLDGLFYKNVPPHVKLGSYRLWQFFKNPSIGTSWTDHALLSWKVQVRGTN